MDVSVDEEDFASWLAEAEMLGLIDCQHAKSVKVGELSNLVTGDGTRHVQLSNNFIIGLSASAYCEDGHAWFVLRNNLRHEASLCMNNNQVNAAVKDL